MAEIDMNNLPPEVAAYIQSLKKEVTSLKEKIENLNEMLVQGRKMMFGKSSEQLKYIDGAEQISFFNEAEKEYNAAAPEPTEELTENLPHHEVICELDNKNCTECGIELVVIGKEKLRSELNIVPAQIL